ncbi:MAG: hypothetical protein RID81_06945 [Sandaracinaceae bacterium]
MSAVTFAAARADELASEVEAVRRDLAAVRAAWRQASSELAATSEERDRLRAELDTYTDGPAREVLEAMRAQHEALEGGAERRDVLRAHERAREAFVAWSSAGYPGTGESSEVEA